MSDDLKGLGRGDLEMFRQITDGEDVPLTTELFDKLVESAAKTRAFFRERIVMNDVVAHKVRRLRCDDGYTWRAIPEHFDDLYPSGGNQIAGMEICRKAAEFLAFVSLTNQKRGFDEPGC